MWTRSHNSWAWPRPRVLSRAHTTWQRQVRQNSLGKYTARYVLLCIVPLFSLSSTIMDKSLGTLLRFWGVFQFTQVQPLPSPDKQFWMRVSRIFSVFQLCIGWEEVELQTKFRKGCTVLRGNREMTEKYEYCSTIPRTFVQDCSLIITRSVWYRVVLFMLSQHYYPA